MDLATLGVSIWIAMAAEGGFAADFAEAITIQSGVPQRVAPVGRWGGPELPEQTLGEVVLAVVLPEHPAAARLSMRALERLLDRGKQRPGSRDEEEGVVVVFESDPEGLPRGVVPATQEPEARARLEQLTGLSAGGLGVLLDRSGDPIIAGSLDLDLFEHFTTFVEHGLLPLRRDEAVPERWSSTRTEIVRRVDRDRLGASLHRPIADLPLAPSEIACAVRKDGEAIETSFGLLFEALSDRPIERLHIVREYVRAWPDLARDSGLRSEIRRRQRAHLRSPYVQLLVAEVALIGRDVQLAQRAGYAFLACSKGLAGHAQELIELLQDSPGALRLDRLMEHALAVALLEDPTDTEVLRRQFDFHLAVREDFDAARRSGEALIDAFGSDSRGLNAFAWALLTESRYRGRFAGLALLAVRSMERDPRWRTSWRLDTYALAAFENGLVDQAIAMQQEALERCGSGSKPHYQERLKRYERAR